MSKGTSSEKPTHDSEKEKRVFSVDMQAMQSLQQAYSEKACVGARADKQHSSAGQVLRRVQAAEH
jgi:hypothetical protein